MEQFKSEVQSIVKREFPGLSWIFTMRDSGTEAAKTELYGLVEQFDSKKTVGGGLMESILSILEITCE